MASTKQLGRIKKLMKILFPIFKENSPHKIGFLKTHLPFLLLNLPTLNLHKLNNNGPKWNGSHE